MGAEVTLIRGQRILIVVILGIFLVSLIIFTKITLIIIFALLVWMYFGHLLLNLYLVYRSIFNRKQIEISDDVLYSMKNYDWPKYTIICPLFKESEVIGKYISHIQKIDYPKDKLEVILVLEEEDKDTIEKANQIKMPEYFKVIIIPKSYPQTKPKASNIGLKFAQGDLIVVHDAEDRSDPLQLKKAAIGFAQSYRNIGCIQAKLNFYNPDQNFLTKLFTCEYSHWFDLILPGLQSLNAPIPLGGTSNHFKREVLLKLKGWDPYNVTEDCDLGLRIKEAGYQTAILDSTTWEEANCDLKNWIRQRSRWVKGYFQTFLVHSRKPFQTLKTIGLFNSIIFFLTVGFQPVTSLINPLLWIITILYFVFRSQIGNSIEELFPSYVLYPGVFCLFVGNFFYLYNFLIATKARGFNSLVKYSILMPINWLLISVAAWFGLIQLIFKPHYWEKTVHGLIKGEANAE